MKSSELVEGEQYALELPGQDECVRATVVSKPSKPTGKIRVRIERPRRDCVEFEVSCRRIRSTWLAYRSDTMLLVSTAAFDDVAWLPEEGRPVERDDAPGHWIVSDVNLAEGWVEVHGELASIERDEVVPLDQVHPMEATPEPTITEIDAWLRRRGLGAFEKPVERSSEVVATHREEISEAQTVDPRDIRPEVIAKRLLFGPDACDQYREKVERRCRLGDEEERMRREIKNWSKARVLDKANCRRKEFIRYVVDGRFAVVLYGDPRRLPAEIEVDRIVVLKRKRRRKPHSKPAAQRSRKKQSRNHRTQRRRRRPR